MFCPKCGKELPKGTKFCTACGKQIIKEDAVESTLQNNTTNGAAGKKPILIGVIAIVAILAVVLIINAIRKPSGSKGGFNSYEDVIDALFTASYNKDVEAVINCYPKEMESHAIQLYNEYRSKYNVSRRAMFFSFMSLNTDNEYSYEIVEATELEQSEIDELQTNYGLIIDEGYTVEVMSTGKYYQDDIPGMEGYVTNECKGYPKVARIGKSWYLVEGDASLWYSAWYE